MATTRLRTVAGALIVVGAVGCGSSSGGNSTPDATGTQEAGQDATPTSDGSAPHGDAKVDGGPSDVGPDGDVGPDSITTDAGTDGTTSAETGDGGDDSAVNCGTVPPTGTQRVASPAPIILQGGGTTTDHYAFYEDEDAQVLYALPLGGGAAVSVGSMTAQASTVWIHGSTMLFLPAPANPGSAIGPLSSWTAATGTSVISTNAIAFDSYYYTYDVSDDSKYVAYVASTDGLVGTLTVTTVDGKSPLAVVSNVDLSNSYCTPLLEFVGDTLLAYYCAVVTGDAGTSNVTVASFAGPTFPMTSLATFAAPSNAGPNSTVPAQISPDGTMLLLTAAVAPAVTGATLVPIAGGASVTIDSGSQQAAFTPNGDVLSVSATGALVRYSTATPGDAGTSDSGSGGGAAPLTLVATGVEGITQISADGAWVQLVEAQDSGTGVSTGVLASTTIAGTPKPLWAGSIAAGIGFSPDSTFEIYETGYVSGWTYPTPFILEASPVSGGTPTKVVSSAGTLSFTGGTKLVINANLNSLTGSADILALDLASPATSSTLVTQADPNFFYDAATKQLVYTWHCAATASSGVWTSPVP